jgi:DNA-binding CsgD family transcriptional regulator
VGTTSTSRDGEWLDLVTDLMADPLTGWPFEAVARQLVGSFSAPAAAMYSASARSGVEQLGWPPEHFAGHLEEARCWAERCAPTEHPLLRYHLRSGDVRSTQVSEVPRRFADERLVAAWVERGRRWGGVQSQLSITLQFDPPATRALIVGREDPYTPGEMRLAYRLQWLLTGLDRQIGALSRWAGRHEPPAVEAARCLRLSARELAVLELLAQGLTAAAIARRLAIAERTAQKHLQHCYEKLGVADRLDAVLRAQRIGLLRTQLPSLAAPGATSCTGPTGGRRPAGAPAASAPGEERRHARRAGRHDQAG